MSTLERSIYIIGPHSTGKTTLATALNTAFSAKVPLITEVSRGVVKRGGYTAAEISSDPMRCKALQREILQAQFEAEALYAGEGQSFISDRSGVDPIIYAARYINDEAAKEICDSTEWQTLRKRYADPNKSLIVLLEPNMKFWEDDRTRLLSHDWQDWWNFKEMFDEFLTTWNLPYRVIETSCESLRNEWKKFNHGLYCNKNNNKRMKAYNIQGLRINRADYQPSTGSPAVQAQIVTY